MFSGSSKRDSRGISFSCIFYEWNKWIKQENIEAIFDPENSKNEDRIRRARWGMRIVGLNLAPAFVKYISQKYGKPHVAEKIAHTVWKDAERFLKNHGVTKKRSRSNETILRREKGDVAMSGTFGFMPLCTYQHNSNRMGSPFHELFLFM
jgi:hypothetical protein